MQLKALLEGAGYVLGADGIYEHPTDGRLSLRVGTTGGNQLRELQQQLIQAQMLEAGIEIVIENLPGSEYFSIPFGGDPTVWELTQFAWVGGPWPGSGSFSFRTDSGNNPYGYASPGFDAKADECDLIVDEAEAATCYNELDEYVTTLGPDGDGLIVLPLTQKPSFYALQQHGPLGRGGLAGRQQRRPARQRGRLRPRSLIQGANRNDREGARQRAPSHCSRLFGRRLTAVRCGTRVRRGRAHAGQQQKSARVGIFGETMPQHHRGGC